MFNITSEYRRFAMLGIHIQHTAYNHRVPILSRIKTPLLSAEVQSRWLLSLTGNRAYANRSQPLKQLSRFVCHRVPSDWHSLYALIHRNGITLLRRLGKLTFLFQERAPPRSWLATNALRDTKVRYYSINQGVNRIYLSLFNRQVLSH